VVGLDSIGVFLVLIEKEMDSEIEMDSIVSDGGSEGSGGGGKETSREGE
jgi:hypothetical protein